MTNTRRRAALGAAAIAGAVGITATVSAQSEEREDETEPGIVDVVLEVSGTEGFDTDGRDYDLLREALVATGLAGAVAEATDITVFAPNDWAFINLARDLGYHDWDEAGALAFLVEATGFESAADPGLLDDVLRYHVAPGEQRRAALNAAGPIETLLDGATVDVVDGDVVDGDPNDRDARIILPFNLDTESGIIHTVDRVLRPIDLEAAPSDKPGIVGTVIALSGPDGLDTNGRDYDLLREALVATGLAGAVAEANDITVFAPNDWAFINLARDLGYHDWDEAGALAFLVEATGFESAADPGLLDDVLRYHVAPGEQRRWELDDAGPVATLLDGATVEVTDGNIADGDPTDADARIISPLNVEVPGGIIHTVNRVLRPIDLEAAPSDKPGIVGTVIAISGAEGVDRNGQDYDLLREALVATGLADAVAEATDITVFAPRDWAFINLARDLGFDGWDEAGALAFLIEATGFESAAEPGLLDDVLLYHVLPGEQRNATLNAAGPVPTLLDGISLEVVEGDIVDGDPDALDARIIVPLNVEVPGGIIHTVNRVLRPIDL